MVGTGRTKHVVVRQRKITATKEEEGKEKQTERR